MKPKFKAGDQVIIKNQKGIYECLNGKKGIVQKTYTEHNRRWYRVKFEDGMMIDSSARELEKHEQVTTRTLNLTLDQAKEYYEADGELRKIALQVFTEDELNPKSKYPKTWEEYTNKYSYFMNLYNIETIYPTVTLELQFKAYIRLMSLRYAWIHIWSQEQGLEKDWGPNWSEYDTKYCIVVNDQSPFVYNVVFPVRSLSFPTRELAQDFLNTFKDLLEQAKGLY